MILHDGKKCYRLRYRWEDWLLFPNMGSSSEEKAERLRLFNEIPATKLRQDYDPTAVVIDNYKAIYGSDLSKKIFDRYAFNYGTDGKTVVYTAANFREIESYKDYTQINGKERPRYSFYDRIANNARSYRLRNPNLDTDAFFFEFRVNFEEDRRTPKSYRLYANGTGTKEGSASSSLYQCAVKINKVVYNPSLDKVRIEGSVKIEKEDQIDRDVAAGFEDEWVSVSSKKIPVGSFNVPETITFSAPFFDIDNPGEMNPNAVLNACSKVTFVPESKNGSVIYVPKTDSTYPYDFLAQFAKNYQMLFGTVSLQPDSDIGSDKTTPRFTFSGDSLRIELEDMKHNFVLSEESAASGGKAGKLVDENSRAEAIITFPAGTYSGYAVIRAPSGDNDAFYVKFGDNYIRMYADDPLPEGYARTSRTPINLSCSNEVTVRMAILKDSPDKSGETGMYIDYVEFTKTGSQAGQGDSDTSEPGAGKADWTGFIMVDSADELDFKAGTYEMKCASFEEYQGKTKFDTMIYDVEIIANTAVLREKSRIRVYSNQEDYDVKKASVKDIDGYSWEDSTRTITRTYSDVSDESMPLSEFKEEFFSFPEDAVEDDYSRTHTDKKLGRKNGVIQASCTETIRKTEVERTEKYYYTITLTPQK
ncbi:MAG: hypothetical protein K2J81_06100 [Treponemataceae bacterium]|nr:hypothetical protein [Treponemataceae bacterium]